MLAELKKLSHLHSINPSKRKGQNFLVNANLYRAIAEYAEIKSEDEVLEVGPGLGFLTQQLAFRAKRVVAVELDKKLFSFLQSSDSPIKEFLLTNKVKLQLADILNFNPSTEFNGSYKIVANLPYNITSLFLRYYLSGRNKKNEIIRRPSSLFLMLQKELAQRLVAQPSTMSLLSVSVQHYALPQIIRDVTAGNFWPKPKVDSALVKLNVFPRIYQDLDDDLFFILLRAGFSAKRKMLKNNLNKNLNLSLRIIQNSFYEINLSEKIRAEDLGLNDWYCLFAKLKEFML